jgi:hypothetical protein
LCHFARGKRFIGVSSQFERLHTPTFAPLTRALERLPHDRWPSHEELTALADGIVTSRGTRLRFVMPRDRTGNERRYYELRIAETGEVETRPENWHDLFNALAWITYPLAKAAINAQHVEILEERGDAEAKRRSPERDALTLFDEGGIAVMSTDPALFDLIVAFEWKELFWHRRGELERHMRFLAFGHALYEQALEPYLGMVAKTIFFAVDSLPSDAALVDTADAALARHFSDRSRFASPRMMAPMPVLGIPGWHVGTETEAFYDDRSHFRPKSPKR